LPEFESQQISTADAVITYVVFQQMFSPVSFSPAEDALKRQVT
jgi:hypothetical protein